MLMSTAASAERRCQPICSACSLCLGSLQDLLEEYELGDQFITDETYVFPLLTTLPTGFRSLRYLYRARMKPSWTKTQG